MTDVERIRWEYRVVNLGIVSTAERMQMSLARLGAGGWELVTVLDKSSNWFAGAEKGFLLFKRAVQPGDPEPAAWATIEDAAGDVQAQDDSKGWY